jgi:branched-chain amino acid transport system permease protein
MAFNTVYLPTRVFHFALAGVYAATPFFAWQFREWKLSWLAAVGLTLLFGTLFSLACEACNHFRLQRKGSSSGAHFVSSLGIYIVAVQVIALTWGNETKVLRVGVDSVAGFGQTTLTHAQLIAGSVSLGLLAVFYCWLRFTNFGLRLRALAENPVQLALQGYNTRRLRLVAFGVAGLLASTASLLVAYDIGFGPHDGLAALLLAIVAVIVGGRDTWLGPVLGAIALGLLRSEIVWFLSARWQDAVTFALLALFLFLRPHGLFGRKIRLEAAA